MRQGDSRGKDADRLRLTLDPESRLGAKIKVIGVGGGGATPSVEWSPMGSKASSSSWRTPTPRRSDRIQPPSRSRSVRS